MRVGVLGTGMVGEAIATRLCELGHEVMLGSRSATNEKALAWAEHHAPHASVGTFAEAAAYGSFAFHCTHGETAEDVLRSAAEGLAGKLVIDTSNPLDFSGDAPGLFVAITDSLAERLQRAVPEAKIVKALNTITASVMVHPEGVPGEHVTFIAAKTKPRRPRPRPYCSSSAGRRPRSSMSASSRAPARRRPIYRSGSSSWGTSATRNSTSA
jgi:predicted dinucleotide-binding enzyme